MSGRLAVLLPGYALASPGLASVAPVASRNSRHPSRSFLMRKCGRGCGLRFCRRAPFRVPALQSVRITHCECGRPAQARVEDAPHDRRRKPNGRPASERIQLYVAQCQSAVSIEVDRRRSTESSQNPDSASVRLLKNAVRLVWGVITQRGRAMPGAAVEGQVTAGPAVAVDPSPRRSSGQPRAGLRRRWGRRRARGSGVDPGPAAAGPRGGPAPAQSG